VAEPGGFVEHASMSLRVPRRLRDAPPALEQLKNRGQIERLCGLCHRRPEIPIEVPSLFRKQETSDRPRHRKIIPGRKRTHRANGHDGIVLGCRPGAI
jgi:hypothetical protein